MAESTDDFGGFVIWIGRRDEMHALRKMKEAQREKFNHLLTIDLEINPVQVVMVPFGKISPFLAALVKQQKMTHVMVVETKVTSEVPVPMPRPPKSQQRASVQRPVYK